MGAIPNVPIPKVVDRFFEFSLLGMLAASLLLDAPWYRLAFCVQVGFYAAGLVGIRWKALAARFRLVSVAASFMVLNAAAWLAFWVWLSGKTSRSWVKVSYKAQVGSRAKSREPATALATRQPVDRDA